ncbi:MAG: hypothetical protein KDH19_20485, partial [Geminicoccaceae bacterium]|nr:hypothetical protein [Geminicoccaceae bacterium]
MSDRISLSEGIYTIPEAARLVRTPQPKVRGWIAGYPNTKARPLLENQIGYADGKLAIGFQNLLEVRFVKLFSSFGVSVKALRAMLDEAKKVLNHPHPFSTDAVFKTDGRKIFLETAKTTDDKALYDLQAKNWTMHDVIKQSLLN